MSVISGDDNYVTYTTEMFTRTGYIRAAHFLCDLYVFAVKVHIWIIFTVRMFLICVFPGAKRPQQRKVALKLFVFTQRN